MHSYKSVTYTARNRSSLWRVLATVVSIGRQKGMGGLGIVFRVPLHLR